MDPDFVGKLVWDSLVNFSFMLSFFFIPFVIGTQGWFHGELATVEMIFNVIMFLDVVCTFFTAYEGEEGLIYSPWIIATKYCFGYLIFDLLAVLPGLFTVELVFKAYYFKIFRYMQVGWFFEELTNMIHRISKLFVSFTVTKVQTVMSLLWLLLTLSLLIHMGACIYMLFGLNHDDGWAYSEFLDDQ